MLKKQTYFCHAVLIRYACYRKNGVFCNIYACYLDLDLDLVCCGGNKLYVFCKDIVIYSIMWKYKDITTM